MKDQSGKNLNEPAFMAQATKPQSMKNVMGMGGGTFTPGTAPRGGFQAVWNFGPDPKDYKNSPVSKPEKGVV